VPELKRALALAAGVVLLALVLGCASDPYREDVLIIDYPCPPRPGPWVPPPPPVGDPAPTVADPGLDLERHIAIDRRPNDDGTATKTLEDRAPGVAETPRPKPARDEGAAAAPATPQRDEDRATPPRRRSR
jgi:hypothetical protein